MFLDNTCSTNKHAYLMGWAWETVEQGRLDLLQIPFLIAGHTKFSPDLLFSRISKTYNCRDVFSTTEQKNDVMANYADVTEDDGSVVRVWREPLSVKYSKMQGIRSLHDFVFSKHCLTGEVVPRVHALCYTGPLKNMTGSEKTRHYCPNTHMAQCAFLVTQVKKYVQRFARMLQKLTPIGIQNAHACLDQYMSNG